MYFGSNEKAYHGSKIHKILKITNQIRNILNIRDVFNKYYVPCFTILIVSSNPKIKIKQKSQNYDFLQLLPSFSDANIVLENSRENSHSRDLLNIKRAVLRFGAD